MKLFDKVGVFLSGLCVVHCLFLPVIFFALPGLTAFFETEHHTIHQLLLGGVMSSVLLSFTPGYQTHRHKGPFLISFIGLGLLSFGAYPDLLHTIIDHSWELAISLTGSIFMIIAHILNHNLCKKCTTHKGCHKTSTWK